ncbi:unnamed protein product [Rhodiola kirilowii]
MTLKEGQSITRPPLLEGSNYACWKPDKTALSRGNVYKINL